MVSYTRSRVSLLTIPGAFITRLTVLELTPALAAISLMVTARF